MKVFNFSCFTKATGVVKSALLLLFLCGFYGKLEGQIYPVQNYSTENGLASRNIIGITQDSNGRLWVATNVGVSSYDGYEWSNYDLKEKFFSSRFNKIKCDSKGYVWAIPQKVEDNIIVFKDGKWELFGKPVNVTITKTDITSFDIIYQNDKPVLFVGTLIGLYVFKDGSWKYYNEDNGLSGLLVHNLVVDNDSLFIATSKGLLVYKDGEFNYSYIDVLKKDITEVLCVYFEKQNGDSKRMWVLGADKLGYIENGAFTLFRSGFQLPVIGFTGFPMLSMDSKGNIFFGNLLARYYTNKSNDAVKLLSQVNGFGVNSGPAIFIDREENAWFGDRRGLDRLITMSFRNHNMSIGLLEDEVSAFSEIGNEIFLVGYNSGISIFENHKFRHIRFNELNNYSPNASRVLHINNQKKDIAYISASKTGFGSIDSKGNMKWFNIPKLLIASSSVIDKNGEVLIGSNMGCYILKGNEVVKYEPLKTFDKYTRKIFCLDDNSLWFTGDEGVFSFKEGILKNYKCEYNALANKTFSVFKDSQNRILVGSLGGLFEIKEDSLSKFTDNGFAVNDAVFAIMQDCRNDYWFGTNKDVIRWNGKSEVTNFNSKNGLVKGEISRSALFEDSKGSIWIGTDAGLSRFIPELENKQKYIPNLELLSIENLNGDIYNPSGELSLNPIEANLKFNLRGISFVSENTMTYQIKLEGHDNDWLTVTQQQLGNIVYKNLEPGDYKFFVKVKNYNSEWSKEISTGDITVLPPVFKRWWFIALAVLLVIGLLYSMHMFVMNKRYLNYLETKVERRTEELTKSQNELKIVLSSLEDRVDRRTKELAESNAAKDKFFSIIAHDLRNPFTNVLGYIELLLDDYRTLSREEIKLYADNIKKSAQNTYDLLENLLQWGRINTGKIKNSKEKVNLFNRVDKMINLVLPMAVKKEITIQNNLRDIVFIEGDKYILQTVLQNVLTNAVKFTPHNGTINVDSRTNDETIDVLIKDSGIGMTREQLNDLFKIDKAHSNYGTEREMGTGLGLILCKEMMDLLEGKMEVESNPGLGSVFTLTFKLWKNSISS